MKKLILLIMYLLCGAQLCLAGNAVTVRVSVIIPELPQAIDTKESVKDTIVTAPQKHDTITITTTALRNNQKIILNTVVPR